MKGSALAGEPECVQNARKKNMRKKNMMLRRSLLKLLTVVPLGVFGKWGAKAWGKPSILPTATVVGYYGIVFGHGIQTLYLNKYGRPLNLVGFSQELGENTWLVSTLQEAWEKRNLILRAPCHRSSRLEVFQVTEWEPNCKGYSISPGNQNNPIITTTSVSTRSFRQSGLTQPTFRWKKASGGRELL